MLRSLYLCIGIETLGNSWIINRNTNEKEHAMDYVILGFLTAAIRNHCDQSGTSLEEFLAANLPDLKPSEIAALVEQFKQVEHTVAP